MAAATISSRNDSVIGDKRLITALATTAATGDTWVTGLSTIFTAQCDGGSTTAINTTFSGGTVTFNYAGGGAATSADIMVIGL